MPFIILDFLNTNETSFQGHVSLPVNNIIKDIEI